MSDHDIRLTVNGKAIDARVPARRTLLDFLRADCTLTGTHAGCEHGVCGACTVIVEGAPVRSCLMLSVQANGCEVSTIESIAAQDGTLDAVQTALHEENGLQCGFCTAGIVMSLVAVQRRKANADRADFEEAMSGHLCRCTGYQGIKRAIERIAGDAA